MFGNSLENLGKSTREYKNKHSDKFPKFLKIFGNLWKSSEKIGECRKVLKTTFQAFLNFFFEIFGNYWKSLEVRKLSESSQNNLPTIFVNFRKLET